MILESLIQDESVLTLDCAKARIVKGQRINIHDKYWHDNEVQGAIALGLIRLVGELPSAIGEEMEPTDIKREKTKRLVSAAKSRLAFECNTKYKNDQTGEPVKWKDYVDPGAAIYVPESAMYSNEIQNALGWGLLVDPEAEFVSPHSGSPADLQETTIGDLSNIRRPVADNASGDLRKAKPIRASADRESEGDDEALFRPSKVIDALPAAPRSRQQRAMPASSGREDVEHTPSEIRDDFDSSFEDLFGFDPDSANEDAPIEE